MDKWLPVGIYLLSGLVAAISQIILKKAAVRPNGKAGIMKYMDARILAAYALLLLTLFMGMVALRYMPYKYAPVLSTFSYIFVLVLGKAVLKEQASAGQMAGAALIIAGIVLFHAG